MNLDTLTESELSKLKDLLVKELNRLRSTKKNLNHTIKNITDDMHEYRMRHQILVENPQELPRA
jgi:hypothetical protein